MSDLSHLLPVLQTAIGPVILISGIGLLLLSMTNRYGRTIDRSRVLAHERRACADEMRTRCEAQIAILSRRMLLVRRAITLASFSILLAAVLIIAIFVAALIRIDIVWIVALVFIGCMACLIASLIAFIQDINQSLIALRLELGAS